LGLSSADHRPQAQAIDNGSKRIRETQDASIGKPRRPGRKHKPASLPDIRSGKGGTHNFADPTTERWGSQSKDFYYQLAPSGAVYNLFSFGLDGVPCTADDIFPSLSGIAAPGYAQRACPLN
jgi:hypothetical protein